METKLKNVCIFCFGFVQAVTRIAIWMSIEDIVAGTLIQSSTVMILFAAGDLAIRSSAPFLIRNKSFLRAMILLGFLWLTSYLLMVAVDDVRLRLAGSFFAGTVTGLSNVVIFLLMAYFQDVEKSATMLEVGVDVSTMVFGLFYSGSTIWLCLPPRITIVVMYLVSLLMFLFYGILNHGPLKKYQIQEYHEDVQYKSVSLTDKNESKQKRSHFLVKIEYILDVFPFFGYYFVNIFCFYLAATSVLTTLAFPSSPFRVRDHYHYYRLSGDFGMVLGAVELMLFSFLCPSWIDTLRIKKILILLFVNFGHLMFFLFESWYHFVPNVYILIALSGTHGLVFGSLTVRVVAAAANSFGSSHEKGLALTITLLGCSVGRLLAGLIGVYVEENLREHCTNHLLMGQFCLARFPSSVGWNDNLQCH